LRASLHDERGFPRHPKETCSLSELRFTLPHYVGEPHRVGEVDCSGNDCSSFLIRQQKFIFTGFFNLGALNAGAQATVTIVGTAEAAGGLTNSVEVQGSELDSYPADNLAIAYTVIREPARTTVYLPILLRKAQSSSLAKG